MLAMLTAMKWTFPTYAGRWWCGGLVSIRHYQLRCRKEASSNCYHTRKKAGKKIREKVVLIMRQCKGSIDGRSIEWTKTNNSGGEEGDTYPRSR